METGIIIALIMAITSLAVALFGIFQTRINSRSNVKAEISKDKYKHSHLQFEKRIDGLDSMISDIQLLKDRMQVILDSRSKSLEAKSTIKMVEDSRKRIFNDYETYISFFDKKTKEEKYPHIAKGISLDFENLIVLNLKNEDYVELKADVKNEIRELRNRLSEFQEILRDNKSTILFEYIQKSK